MPLHRSFSRAGFARRRAGKLSGWSGRTVDGMTEEVDGVSLGLADSTVYAFFRGKEQPTIS